MVESANLTKWKCPKCGAVGQPWSRGSSWQCKTCKGYTLKDYDPSAPRENRTHKVTLSLQSRTHDWLKAIAPKGKERAELIRKWMLESLDGGEILNISECPVDRLCDQAAYLSSNELIRLCEIYRGMHGPARFLAYVVERKAEEANWNSVW